MSGSSTKFDWLKVRASVRKTLPEVLARQGAYMRGVARRMIHKRTNRALDADPGEPPFSHPANRDNPRSHGRDYALRESVEFIVEPESNRVVIGPRASWIGNIARLHEFGGTVPGWKRHQRIVNWRLVVGGHGPIAMRDGTVRFAKYRSAAQVQRALDIIHTGSRLAGYGPKPAWVVNIDEELEWERSVQALSLWTVVEARKTKHYPPRPFMAPALGIAQQRLPGLWANSVHE